MIICVNRWNLTNMKKNVLFYVYPKLLCQYALQYVGWGKSDLAKVQQKFMQDLLKKLEPLNTHSIYLSLF